MKKDAEMIGVWGRRGSGKSTKMRNLTQGRNRIIVVDPMEGHDYMKAGYKPVRNMQQLYKHLKQNWDTGFKVVICATANTAWGFMLELAHSLFVIQSPYKRGKDSRKITLVVDEMSICVPNKTMSDDEKKVLHLFNAGRHSGIEIIGASQRLAQVHGDFRGNTSQDFFFAQRSHLDYTAAKQLLGNENEAKLRALGEYEYLHFKDGVATVGKDKL